MVAVSLLGVLRSMCNACVRYSKQGLAPLLTLVTVVFSSVVWLASQARASTGRGELCWVMFCASHNSELRFHFIPLSHVLFSQPCILTGWVIGLTGLQAFWPLSQPRWDERRPPAWASCIGSSGPLCTGLWGAEMMAMKNKVLASQLLNSDASRLFLDFIFFEPWHDLLLPLLFWHYVVLSW